MLGRLPIPSNVASIACLLALVTMVLLDDSFGVHNDIEGWLPSDHGHVSSGITSLSGGTDGGNSTDTPDAEKTSDSQQGGSSDPTGKTSIPNNVASIANLLALVTMVLFRMTALVVGTTLRAGSPPPMVTAALVYRSPVALMVVFIPMATQQMFLLLR